MQIDASKDDFRYHLTALGLIVGGAIFEVANSIDMKSNPLLEIND